jgi:predicted nucleic acid-binding protein
MTELRLALDTDILAYAEGQGDSTRCRAARDLVGRLPEDSVIVPTQVLGELYRVMNGKGRMEAAACKAAVQAWADAFEVADSTWSSMQAALDLSCDHDLQIWDALIVSVAAEQHCRLLLSEDLQNGLTWRGVSIVNPFLHQSHPLLESMTSNRR